MRDDGRIIVIADDITGAAEIAGIAHSHGMGVRLLCGANAGGCAAAQQPGPAPQVTVIATDTRSMTEAEAVAETHRVAGTPDGVCTNSGTAAAATLFKKTDSALRGHVVGEFTALMEATGCRRAVYLPANPSKGRIIRAGTYYILTAGADGHLSERPIAETDFRFDPEFPARTSSLRERFPDAESHGILMPDAASADDIRRIVARYNDGHTLFAGAADLFTELLLTLQPILPPQGREAAVQQTGTAPPHPCREGAGGWTGDTLILCGSTQSRALDLGIPVAPMPREIYDGADDLTLWDTAAYDAAHSLILTIPHTHRTGKAVAVHLRTVMASMAGHLVARHRPAQLIIEGGATAWATLRTLGWTAFEITCQHAPGVVQMRAESGTLVTLKPGSYPWGGLF